jgi:hypothetical protein
MHSHRGAKLQEPAGMRTSLPNNNIALDLPSPSPRTRLMPQDDQGRQFLGLAGEYPGACQHHPRSITAMAAR